MVQKIFAIALMVLLLSGVATVGSTLFAGANFRPPPYPRAIITSDGSITPLAVPIQRNGDVYSLAANMSRCALEVERDNIIIDGAGHSFIGNSYETGLTLKGQSNVTNAADCRLFCSAARLHVAAAAALSHRRIPDRTWQHH